MVGLVAANPTQGDFFMLPTDTLSGEVPNYGQVINPLDSTDTSNFIRSLSQEHGIVGCTNDFFNRISIGDIINIYPIHSCLTANLMKAYVTETGKKISHFGSGAPFTG